MVESFSSAAFLRSGAFLRRPDGRTIVAVGLTRAATPSAPVAFYAPDFFLDDTAPWWNAAQTFEWPVETLPDFSVPGQARQHRRWDEPAPGNFRDAFATVRDWFHDEALEKAVLAAFATTTETVDEHDQRAAIPRAWRLPRPFLPCGLWHEGEGFLSATPELLFRKVGDRLETMALASTRKHPSKTPWTAKEIREHDVVIRDLRRVLSAFGEVTVGATGDRVVGSMVHRHAPVTCTGEGVRRASMEDCVRALHPTAALGVAPRTFPWRRLRELDGGFARRRFGAPFAVRETDGSATAVVAIRAVQWNESGCLLASGAGILPESDCEAEWRELALKRKATCEALGL